MAGGAFQYLVRPDESKPIRHRGVLKRGIAPIIYVVAFQARRGKSSTRVLLVIIRLMATDAIVLVRRIK